MMELEYNKGQIFSIDYKDIDFTSLSHSGIYIIDLISMNDLNYTMSVSSFWFMLLCGGTELPPFYLIQNRNLIFTLE